mmetsp:Transcript_93471/g.157109  ORF Transcript_93471/g.157109 Transcript_93471/m.157109 type:complete len:100 (-) Transcript_93471:85-384(-)
MCHALSSAYSSACRTSGNTTALSCARPPWVSLILNFDNNSFLTSSLDHHSAVSLRVKVLPDYWKQVRGVHRDILKHFIICVRYQHQPPIIVDIPNQPRL